MVGGWKGGGDMRVYSAAAWWPIHAALSATNSSVQSGASTLSERCVGRAAQLLSLKSSSRFF